MNITECIRKWTSEHKIIALVGGGGKTTLMFLMAKTAAKDGMRVLVATTTHIFRPAQNFADSKEAVNALWAQGQYAVIGQEDEKQSGKLIFPEETLYASLKEEADVILLEADGAKGHPIKVPGGHEPVIPEDTTLVVGVMGMSAYGQKLQDCCFRFATDGGWLTSSEDACFDVQIATKLLASEQGTKKAVGEKQYAVVINQCDDEKRMKLAEQIKEALRLEYNIEAVPSCLKDMQERV